MQSPLSMKTATKLCKMYLAEAADTLSRGFGRQFAESISLTLVEFESGETARKVSPLGSWSRAVPILDENQKVKKLGDLTMELARSLGSCTYCKRDKCKCDNVKDNKCKFETKWADAVEMTIQRVKRELNLQELPVAGIRQGELALTTTETNEEKKQATGEHDVEDGQIEEETTEDDVQFNNLVKQLDGDSKEKSTVHKLNFEEKKY